KQPGQARPYLEQSIETHAGKVSVATRDPDSIQDGSSIDYTILPPAIGELAVNHNGVAVRVRELTAQLNAPRKLARPSAAIREFLLKENHLVDASPTLANLPIWLPRYPTSTEDRPSIV
ncbi:MAG: hypothetical protein ABL886_12495, partial [Rhodoglobus sp.]